MGFVRQSFKRQLFITFLAVTLILVIVVGAVTIQGFQARVKADYEKRDAEREKEVEDQINGIILGM